MLVPKVTIIIVTLNAEATIRETLLSAIGQTCPSKEIVVVDGVSTDQTLPIINAFRDDIDVIVSEKDKGLYDAMNKGVHLASGEYLFFLNAGDVFFNPHSLETMFKETEGSPDLIYGDVRVIYPSGANRVHKGQALIHLWKGMCFSHQASLSKRSLHLRYPFNVFYRVGADYDFYVKMYRDKAIFTYVSLVVATVSSGGLSDVQRLATLQEWERAWRQHGGSYTLVQTIYRLWFFCRTRMVLFLRSGWGRFRS